jgi:enamine deaminase RidA (YjgF/YER057c/UK114 family)
LLSHERARVRISESEKEIEMSKEFLSPKTLIPPGPAGYSHIAKVNGGTIVYLSGQVPSDASGKLIGEGDFEAQVEQVFANLKLAVEAAGGTMADIVKLNYYVVAELDQASVPKLRPIRDRYINVEKPPASTVCRGQPPDAAGLADRDRGGGGDRCVKRKRRP